MAQVIVAKPAWEGRSQELYERRAAERRERRKVARVVLGAGSDR
jgi:hypothetical protein